jgi:flagellar biosynthesis/type III secretory pathway M-ring protein FliF/YscJ
MYTHSILLLLSWPVIILISWFVIRYVITRYEKKQAKKQEQSGQVS